MQSKQNIIRTLQKLRDDHYSQLDIRILEELDSVIETLKKSTDNTKGNTQTSAICLRALQVISTAISIVSNITDLMK